MTEPERFLSEFPGHVASKLRVALPDLRECRGIFGAFDLGMLKSTRVLSPSVMVAMLGAREGKAYSSGYQSFDLSMAAYVATRDAQGLDRDTAAFNIGRALLLRIPGHRWGRDEVGVARDIRLVSLINKNTKGAAASLLAVTWTQPAMLKPVSAAEPVVPELYIGQAPEIGADHEDDYERIGVGA